MNRLLILLAILVITSGSYALAQADIEPGTVPWTPVVDTGLVQISIEVPSEFSGVNLHPVLNAINVRPGWKAVVYYAGQDLDKPRFMTWGPDSVLYVANMDGDEILAIPDEDNDGIGDGTIRAARTPNNTHDVKFYRDTMYVVSERGVYRRWRTDASSYEYDQVETLIDKERQPNQVGGNHVTRTLVIDSTNQRLFLSVGSRGNADRETNRGVIEAYDWDGTNRRVYSRGVRNAVGMTLHPRTGEVWANNNGSDQQGNNIPPEWVDLVRDDGFYGYPIAYNHQNYFNFTHPSYKDLLPITADDSADVRSMVPPAALVASHCAPMALEFANVDRPGFSRYGAFMAMRGSWNRTPISGAKIVYLSFDNDQDTIANEVVDFCTGFIRDSNNVNTRWARPVGIALARDGSVFVSSDDVRQFILKLTPPVSTSVYESDNNDDQTSLHVYPNPATTNVTVKADWLTDGETINVYSLSGRHIVSTTVSGGETLIDTSDWGTGRYEITVQKGSSIVNAFMTVTR